MNITGLLILVGICCIVIFLFGIGFFTETTHPLGCECRPCLGLEPTPSQFHSFRLLGEDGGLPMFLAFAWFINLLWFVTAGWSMICGAEELTPQVVVTAILFFVLMFGAAITMQM